MILTSLDNDKVKRYIKLKQKKYRDTYEEFIVEGRHLVLEAYKKGLIKELILESDEVFPLDVETVYVTKEIISKITDLPSPSTVMALCKKMDSNNNLGNRILLLDGLQDPGNIGTIIRSAVAFGIDTIVFGKNTVDLYNPKILRSTQGMNFYVNIIFDDLEKVIKNIKESNIPLYGTTIGYGEDVRNLNSKDKSKYVLVVGNEGNGVRKEINELCDKNLYIDMSNNVDSLNVAIATSILLYELGR